MEFGILGWWLLLGALFQLSFIHGCLREEKVALLQFKASLMNSSHDDVYRLTSWNSSHEDQSNCCDWECVVCDNTTGRVIKLYLDNVRMIYNVGNKVWYLNASLFLPFQELKYLDLSNNRISGWVPNEGFERLSGLSKLEVLNLGGNYISISDLGRLKNLQELHLDGSYIDESFLHKVGVITSLNVLTIQGCRLNGSLPIVKGLCELMNLRELDLSYNNFEGMLPSCLANMTELRIFDLSFNRFNGSIDLSPLPSLKSLEYLDLSHNYFNPITFSSFLNLSKLETILIDDNTLVDETLSQIWIPSFQLKVFSCSSCLSDKSNSIINRFLHSQFDMQLLNLPHNNLAGKFPTWLLENNTRLESLNLRNNSFTGTLQLPNHHIPNLTLLDISFNHIEGPISTNFASVFPKLQLLKISENDFEGVIPSSFGNLVDLKILDMSSNNFSGTLPESLIVGCSSLKYLKLSKNHLSGQLFPTNFNPTELKYLFLDNNHFSGDIPHGLYNSSDLCAIDFSNNNLSGMLPRWLGTMPFLTKIALAKNQLKGPIPIELCDLGDLLFLDLSQNILSGSIPSCFKWSNIRHVFLNKNKLTGPITSAFKGCNALVTLNLRDNYLTGNIPDWIGNLSSLSVLLLKANYLRGKIPFQLCVLENLSLLDLSHNSFSGQIPHCLSNITLKPIDQKVQISRFFNYDTETFSMSPFLPSPISGFGDFFNFFYKNYEVELVGILLEVEFTTKNRILSYKGDILDYMCGIDLSCNKLEGEIPIELGDLSSIHALNLSFNNLTGSIPTQFSKLKQIESLDLSHNKLDGIIPPQLIELTSLAVFKVAYNNLRGKTPERKAQFATFDESSYEGNPFLCGPPLYKACTKIEQSSAIPTANEGDETCGFMDLEVFYVSFVVTYAIMLLGIIAVLYINPHWRRTWFNFIEVCISTCYYFVVINTCKLSRFRIV